MNQTSGPAAAQSLRVALLTYRGKTTVGGQGVYVRHLSKALVDLGHHVEVFGGQPYPVLDDRIPLHKLPSLDTYNDHFPMRKPRIWELKSLPDVAEGVLVRHRQLPRADVVLAGGRSQRCAIAAPTSTSCTTTRRSAGASSRCSATGWPIL